MIRVGVAVFHRAEQMQQEAVGGEFAIGDQTGEGFDQQHRVAVAINHAGMHDQLAAAAGERSGDDAVLGIVAVPDHLDFVRMAWVAAQPVDAHRFSVGNDRIGRAENQPFHRPIEQHAAPAAAGDIAHQRVAKIGDPGIAVKQLEQHRGEVAGDWRMR